MGDLVAPRRSIGSAGRDKLPKKKLPTSCVERDLKVIEAISQTLYVLELLNSAPLEAQGTKYRLDFTAEINRLRGALRIMRFDDGQRSDP
jgi:hypothetical protein